MSREFSILLRSCPWLLGGLMWVSCTSPDASPASPPDASLDAAPDAPVDADGSEAPLDGSEARDAGPPDAPSDAFDLDALVAAPECNVTAPTACVEPAPTYTNDIAPLIETHCLNCHDGQPAGPWPLTNYQHVASWYDNLRVTMLNCTMPPPDEPPMSDTERELMLQWLRCGYPE